jgi:hypothetical protein
MNTDRPRTLPSREISYNYCVAMFIAQQFEDELRYILDSGDYYGIIEELELTKHEKKKFKDSADWLDKVPSGRLLIALKARLNLAEKHWEALDAAIEDRNFLAHRFLIQFDYDRMTAEKEKRIVHALYAIFRRLWQGLQIVRALRENLDGQTDQIDVHLNELLKSVGVELPMTRKKTQR